MILNFRHLSRIFVLRKGQKKMDPIAKIMDVVVNPKNLVFEAFWVLVPGGMKLLKKSDILNWQKDIILVKGEDVFVSPGEAIRLKSVLDKEIPLMRAKVFCNNQLLGKVVDFTFDTLSPRVLQLYIRGGFLGMRKSLVHVSRIYDVNENGIYIWDNATIKSLEDKVKEEEGSVKSERLTVDGKQ